MRDDLTPQCVSEGWSDKIKEQAEEGCNLEGKVRVNKVVGNLCVSGLLSKLASLADTADRDPTRRLNGPSPAATSRPAAPSNRTSVTRKSSSRTCKTRRRTISATSWTTFLSRARPRTSLSGWGAGRRGRSRRRWGLWIRWMGSRRIRRSRTSECGNGLCLDGGLGMPR